MAAMTIEGVAMDVAGFVTSKDDRAAVRVRSATESDDVSVKAFFENGGRECWVGSLAALAECDVQMIACPESPSMAQALVEQCERLRYRMAILDSVPQSRSSYAAVYGPFLNGLPPSGFVAGVWAATPVWKAPANVALKGVKGPLEVVRDPRVNAIREFAGRGILVWGARTLSDDPEWKYVNVRRLVIYLERSIEQGLQWVGFEPNDVATWKRVTQSVQEFLSRVWRDGALQGKKPEEAYFVKCEMTQNDLDRGRLVVEVGVAPIKPAEFVIFRIGLLTA